MSVVVGSIVLAGAAAAAATYVSLRTDLPSASTATMVERDAPAATPIEQLFEELSPAVASTPTLGDGVTSVELVEAALSLAPLVRRPPDYPSDALRQRVGGHVQLKFDVTATGFVENVSVVDSSDAQFEEPALRAIADWRYLPRIVAGKRVAAKGIHTIIRWEPPSAAEQLTDQREDDAQQEAYRREFMAFSDDLEIALDRLAADDLRGAELQLDEMQAIYGAGRPDLWSFYGYLFTVQGNYDRAIDAYEKSLAAYAAARQPRSGPWVALANLYFARHQYDVALNTLVRQRAFYDNARINNEGENRALIAKLRELGLTHESLEAP